MHESSLVRCLVDNHAILYVIASVADNSNDCIGSLGILLKSKGFVSGRLYDGLLYVVQGEGLVVVSL